MKAEQIQTKFENMGARMAVRVNPQGLLRDIPWNTRRSLRRDVRRILGSVPRRFSIDVETDKHGEFFVINVNQAAHRDLEFTVLDLRRNDRHLLLMVEDGDRGQHPNRGDIQKYLCGHDERHWFVAAVPEDAHARNVADAKEALKPAIVRHSQSARRVKPKDRNRRKNAGFVRQGEWFFVPAPDILPPDEVVLYDEPLRRGNGKPHRAQFLYRTGGVRVHVCETYPNGLTDEQYARLIQRRPRLKSLPWRVMMRDPGAYVKGRVTHPDHKTVILKFWHQVVPNTESRAAAMRNMAFLD